MAKGRSCCCSGLSKGWWWFLTLVGLPLLYALMLNSKWGVIEDDISTSTTQKLKDAGAHWVNVDVEGRARDVLLTGTATTDAERDSAIQTALGVDGVRKVDSDITVVSLKERALTANYMHKDGKLVIEGELESQKKVDEMLKLLADKVGLDNIDNKLTVSDKFSPEGGTITLSGMVLSDDKRSGLSSALQAGSSALGLKFADNLEIDTEAVKAIAEVAEKAEADKLAAEKAEADKLASEKAEADKLAAEKAEADKLASEKAEADKLASEKAEADKLAAEKAEADKLASEKAEADKLAAEKAEADKLASEKAEADKLAAEKAEADKLAAEKAEADKLAAEKAEADKLAAEKAEADKLAAEKAEADKLASEKAEADKLAAEKAEADKLAAKKASEAKVAQARTCQTKLNSAMSGKTILFRTNKANIKKPSFSLLKQIANVIGECRTTLPDANIMVSGHTDSRGSGAYNLSLSQRRADAVKTHLTGIGVSNSIITSKGFGESEPVASNDTVEGRAQNRRITFSVK